jgi:hypothetical protein
VKEKVAMLFVAVALAISLVVVDVGGFVAAALLDATLLLVAWLVSRLVRVSGAESETTEEAIKDLVGCSGERP